MHHLFAHQLHELFLKKELSAKEITQKTFDRIVACDASLGAFLSLRLDEALVHASKLDHKLMHNEPIGKLAGIPIALKDNIHLFNEKTSCGSLMLANYTAVFNATVTSLIEQEGGLIIGKTNMDEFAMGSSTEHSAFKKTKNPWNLHHTPGGSSGGSAAAVAARLCPLALGSDTGGSIRQPAAFCGTVGFKPSYGRVSRYGLVAFGSSLDQIGPLANCVKDAALLYDVIAKPCRYDATSLPHTSSSALEAIQSPPCTFKIGVPWDFLQGLPPETFANFQASLEIFKNQGCQIVDISLDVLKYSIAVYYILATAEASTNLARFDGVRYGHRSLEDSSLEDMVENSREEGFGSEVKRRILLGTYVLSSGYKDAYYQKAQKVRTLIIEQYKKAFEMCDMIATPTAPTTAFAMGQMQDPLQMYLQDIYTVPVNLAGLPAISIPSGFCSKGLPFGLQLVSSFLNDAMLFKCAAQFEKSCQTSPSHPPLF
ncbi:Asp-tRNA(Asn)/Glu-tRNA(Gln) amidotransferase subunit GatA [Rhabdochlamydiaceae symbiont of Dictyostelium giganteum]|uniref:Asp-tRNA(Asn)/Glu-tRNA(Gln) amidotransferase subunit GatA n=1 Tax=Rhabdochlamydiaceae symbiont of Dictyostelium giganteum TaxID=3342349 RepID=UPI00384F45DE